MAGRVRRPIYSRGDNPTVLAFEQKLAALEGAEAARGFASGMAAIARRCWQLLRPGDRMVCVRHCYPDAYRLFVTLLPRFDIRVDFVDGRDLGAVEQACCRARSVLYLESPTSMVFETQDLAALGSSREARRRRHDRRQLLGQPDLPAADRARRRPRGAFRLEISRRPQRRGGGRGLRPPRADRHASTPASSLLSAASCRRSTAGCWCAGCAPCRCACAPPAERARHRPPARRPPAGAARPSPWAGRAGAGRRHAVGRDAGCSRSSWTATRPASPRFCDALKLFKLGVSWGGHESLAFPAAAGARAEGRRQPCWPSSACRRPRSGCTLVWKIPRICGPICARHWRVESKRRHEMRWNHLARRRWSAPACWRWHAGPGQTTLQPGRGDHEPAAHRDRCRAWSTSSRQPTPASRSRSPRCPGARRSRSSRPWCRAARSRTWSRCPIAGCRSTPTTTSWST